MTPHDWTLTLMRVGAWILAAGLLGLILWGAWDLILISRGQLDGNSVSQSAMRALYGWHPGALMAICLALGILIGVLLGHFGWAQVRP